MIEPSLLVFQSPGVGFKIGFLFIHWYSLLIATGLILATFLSQYLAEKRNTDPELVAELIIWLVLGAIPCARIYYVLFNWHTYQGNFYSMIAIWEGGIAIHGAIIGGFLGAILFCKYHQQSLWKMLDLVVPSLILGQAIGRWGNFFNSEAFGNPTDLPWKLYIPLKNRPEIYKSFEYFHPTFLYESLWNLGVFILLLYLFFWGLKNQDKFKTGTITCVYFIAYSIGRFWIESLRTDSLMFGGLKMAQLVSISAILIAGFGLIWLYGMKRKLPDLSNKWV